MIVWQNVHRSQQRPGRAPEEQRLMLHPYHQYNGGKQREGQVWLLG